MSKSLVFGRGSSLLKGGVVDGLATGRRVIVVAREPAVVRKTAPGSSGAKFLHDVPGKSFVDERDGPGIVEVRESLREQGQAIWGGVVSGFEEKRYRVNVLHLRKGGGCLALNQEFRESQACRRSGTALRSSDKPTKATADGKWMMVFLLACSTVR